MATWRLWAVVLLLGIGAGVGSWVGTSIAWDLWQDHQRLHALWDLELRRAQALQSAPGGS